MHFKNTEGIMWVYESNMHIIVACILLRGYCVLFTSYFYTLSVLGYKCPYVCFTWNFVA